MIGAAAQVTSRIGLGTLVASPNFRHPYLLFRDAQALDDLSDGRFLLGVGTGGNLDATLLDLPELTVRERVDRFQEFTETLVALLFSALVMTRVDTGAALASLDAALTSLEGNPTP